MKTLRRLTACLGLLLASSTAVAHVFAVYTTHSHLSLAGASHDEAPKQSVAYIGWGHRMPIEDILAPERLQRYAVIGPDGSETPLTPSSPGFLAVEVTPNAEGGHIVVGAFADHFYTGYIEDGERKSLYGPKTGLDAVEYSGYFEMRGKALVGVGRTVEEAFSTPIGDTLEIVPLENPLRKTGGAYQSLKVQVLYRGEPLADGKVHARHQGYYPSTEFSQSATTDAEGVAVIALTHKGGWLIKAEHETDPRPEFVGQCNTEQYMATLAFELR